MPGFFSFGLAVSFLSFNLFDELPASTVIFLLEAGEAGVVVDKECESELAESWDFKLGRGALATGSAAIEVSEIKLVVNDWSEDWVSADCFPKKFSNNVCLPEHSSQNLAANLGGSFVVPCVACTPKTSCSLIVLPLASMISSRKSTKTGQ